MNYTLKSMTVRYLLCAFLFIILLGCDDATGQSQKAKEATSKEFRDYWYNGTAEITRYKLEQARYGEIHEGEAVLIFVSEDFLSDKQVKYEGGEKTSSIVPIIKLNFTKKFFTGLYPYSMMSSVFTPVNTEMKTMKVTTSSQEWCGHTFTQLNHRGNKYKGVLHSYFMNEGDRKFEIEDVLLEDEIWNQIRLNPDNLPTGNIEIIPSTLYSRLGHTEVKKENAVATLKSVDKEGLSDTPLNSYSIKYTNQNRTVEIIFEKSFPHQIVEWTETAKSGFGNNAKILTTKATKTHQIKNAYWNKNSVSDGNLRKELGLNMSKY